MLNYIIIAIFSYILGILSIMVYCIMKISSDCSRQEEKRDFGQIAYDEIEKREKESGKNE